MAASRKRKPTPVVVRVRNLELKAHGHAATLDVLIEHQGKIIALLEQLTETLEKMVGSR